MRQFSKIYSDITKAIGSSGIQFLITLFTTPIMTRLYEPSAYATFGIINAAATVCIGIGLLSLPAAQPLEKNPVVRTEIIRVMLQLLLALVVLSVLASCGMAVADMLHAGMDISVVALAMFPILVFTFGVRQIMVSIATERANFSSIALAQMLEPVCSRGGSIALGAGFGGHPVFILVSVAVGHLSTAATILKMLSLGILKRWRRLLTARMRMRDILRRYSDFVLYHTTSQQAQPLLMLGVQMGIAAFFSADDAGHYILAVSILTLPGTLIALATAPSVYRHFIEVSRQSPKKLVRHLCAAIALYLVSGIVILVPIFLFGEEIFKFVFGSVWASSGNIAGHLSIAYMAAFAVTGVQSIFRVTRHLKVQFILEVSLCTLSLIVAIFCFKMLDFDTAIRCLAAIWLFRNVVVICGCILSAAHANPDAEAFK